MREGGGVEIIEEGEEEEKRGKEGRKDASTEPHQAWFKQTEQLSLHVEGGGASLRTR